MCHRQQHGINWEGERGVTTKPRVPYRQSRWTTNVTSQQQSARHGTALGTGHAVSVADCIVSNKPIVSSALEKGYAPGALSTVASNIVQKIIEKAKKVFWGRKLIAQPCPVLRPEALPVQTAFKVRVANLWNGFNSTDNVISSGGGPRLTCTCHRVADAPLTMYVD